MKLTLKNKINHWKINGKVSFKLVSEHQLRSFKCKGLYLTKYLSWEAAWERDPVRQVPRLSDGRNLVNADIITHRNKIYHQTIFGLESSSLKPRILSGNINRPLQLLDIVQNKITSTIWHAGPDYTRDQQFIIIDLVLKLLSRGIFMGNILSITISFPVAVNCKTNFWSRYAWSEDFEHPLPFHQPYFGWGMELWEPSTDPNNVSKLQLHLSYIT